MLSMEEQVARRVADRIAAFAIVYTTVRER